MLFAREAELARIDALLEGARQGRGGALVIYGEPGVGKTALALEARERAAGMLVLSVQGIEAEAELPFAGLMVLLSPVIHGIDGLPLAQRDALAGALGLGPPWLGDRFAAYAGTLGLLAGAAEHNAIAVVADDAHWLDRASTEALLFCARRLQRERVCMLVTARTEEMPLAVPVDVPRVHLSGLDAASATRLVERDSRVSVSRAVAAAIHRATGGNPLALRALADGLNDAQLSGTEPLPAAMPVGHELEVAFGRRIAGLPEKTKTGLLLVAASDSGSIEELAGAFRHCSVDLSALEPAEEAGVATIGGGVVEFCHPLIRSAAYEGVSGPERRRAHAALAAVLRSEHDRARRAWHLALAAVEPDEAIAAEIEAAAGEARDRGAAAASGQAFATAARLTPPGPDRARRLLEGANDYYLAGLPESALRLLDEALEIAHDPLKRAHVQRLRARVLTTGQPVSATRDLLVSEAALAQPHDPALAAAMLLDAALTMIVLGDARGSLQLAERAFHSVAERGGTESLIASFVLGVARILAGDARAGYPLVVESTPLVASRELSLFGYIGAMIATAHAWVERYEDGRRMLADIIRRARAQSALMTLPLALAWLADVDQHLGDWSSALAEASESVSLGEEIGRPAELIDGLVVLGWLQARRGESAEARALIARADTIAASIEARFMRCYGRAALGLLELGEGRLADAIGSLEVARRTAVEGGLEEPGIIPWAQDLAEAYARDGRRADAEATVELLEAQAERTGRRLAHAGVARCRGILAGEQGFEEHFDRALAWHQGVSNPFERARTELCLGERLRRARRRREAREWLHRALEAFDGLGAQTWADRSRRELAATGERARRRVPGTADRLTAQELQVATVVAEGATNREAAAALFVTPKTVESHLNSVYRKLGVRSRVELARRLGASESRTRAV